jgi:hypothetical protein
MRKTLLLLLLVQVVTVDPPALIGSDKVSIPVLIGPLLWPLVMARSDWLDEVVLTVTWLKILHHLPHERSSDLAALVPTHVEF